MPRWIRIALTCALSLATANRASAVSDADAFDRVQAGLAHFAKGNFAAAEQAFVEAEKAKPDDLRIAFDRGCAAAAKGEFDAAIDQFRKVAAARDRRLAVQAHVNLAAVAVVKAQRALGERPEAVMPEARSQVRDAIRQALKHYRDAIRMDADASESRTRIESLKLWQLAMEKKWLEADRRRELEALDPLRLLDRFETEQRAIRSEARLQGFSGNSALAASLSERQRQWAQDTPILQAKLESLLASGQQGAPPTNAPQDLRVDQARTAIADGIERLRTAMLAAAGFLQQGDRAALASQGQAIREIVQIDFGLRPFPDLLRKSISRQEALLKLSQGQATQANPGTDRAERADEQSWVADAASQLGGQGAYMLKSIGKANTKSPMKPGAANQQPAANPIESLKPALEKAVELAPAIAEQAKTAAESLPPGRFSAAEPRQIKALELLREIEKHLPKQPPESKNPKDDQQDNKDKQPQPQGGSNAKENKDDRQSNDSKDDQKPEPKDAPKSPEKDAKKEQEKPSDPKQRETPKEQDSKQAAAPKDSGEQPGAQKSTRQGKPVDPARMRIELLAEKVRERDRKHKEAKERFEKNSQVRTKVERDW